MITRRTFLGSSAGLAAQLFATPADSRTPSPDLDKLGAVALAEARRLKAGYCDTRITREALTVARANAQLASRRLVLAPVKAYRDRWRSPFEKNPFDVPVRDKVELLREAARAVKEQKRVFAAAASLWFRSEDNYFASSEGSSIQQLVIHAFPRLTATAVDFASGVTRTRNYVPEPLEAGSNQCPSQSAGGIPNELAGQFRQKCIDRGADPSRSLTSPDHVHCNWPDPFTPTGG